VVDCFVIATLNRAVAYMSMLVDLVDALRAAAVREAAQGWDGWGA
jgi:hypothetical protein